MEGEYSNYSLVISNMMELMQLTQGMALSQECALSFSSY